jgi:hypothetical protein
LRHGLADDVATNGVPGAGDGTDSAVSAADVSGAGVVAAGGSEARGAMLGAMPSSVCERRGLLGLMSGVAVADVTGAARGVVVADGGVEAGTSGVAMADGRVDAGTSGVDTAEGRDASGAEGDEATKGADDGRGIGVGRRAAGLADGRGGGVEALGAGTEARGAGVDDDVAVAASLGSGAGAGISSAPHSASMSSVGGAMDGTTGLVLTRSLSDRLSVIALHSAFHGPQHKSSTPRGSTEIGRIFAAGADVSARAAPSWQFS